MDAWEAGHENKFHFSMLNIAVEGCCHGELDKIYQVIVDNQKSTNKKIDLLLVCGDFECVRDAVDLECLAVPPKYRKLNSFHQYVTGEKVAPVTTVFIGGNHEASNILQSLYYGGWVAPNIYFLGFAGVINFRGLRIAGMSGIFNQKHYRIGHYEIPPYNEDTLRSVYHLRELEVFRMAYMAIDSNQQRHRPIDICLSHDWPAGVWDYGNKEKLLRTKPYFRDDMTSGKLGSPPLMHLLQAIKPRYWFAAHLHVKFAATIPHYQLDPSTDNINSKKRPILTKSVVSTTQFLALDKVLPGREFLQVLEVPVLCNKYSVSKAVVCNDVSVDDVSAAAATDNDNSCREEEDDAREGGGGGGIEYDAEWLVVLQKTHYLLQTHRGVVNLPTTIDPATPEEISVMESHIRKHLNYDSNSRHLYIPPLLPCQPVLYAGNCSNHSIGNSTIHRNYSNTGSSSGGRNCSDRRQQQQQQRRDRYQQPPPPPLLFNPSGYATALGNAQTDVLLNEILGGLPHIWTRPCISSSSSSNNSNFNNSCNRDSNIVTTNTIGDSGDVTNILNSNSSRYAYSATTSSSNLSNNFKYNGNYSSSSNEDPYGFKAFYGDNTGHVINTSSSSSSSASLLSNTNQQLNSNHVFQPPLPPMPPPLQQCSPVVVDNDDSSIRRATAVTASCNELTASKNRLLRSVLNLPPPVHDSNNIATTVSYINEKTDCINNNSSRLQLPSLDPNVIDLDL